MVTKLFGKKLGMTRIFVDEAHSVPVTVLEVGPCVVIQKKRSEKEGYNAIQVGFFPKSEKRLNKPLLGHMKAAGKGGFAQLREIRVEDPDQFELGQEIGADIFAPGERVHVRGTSKGRGFTGVIKRWGFSGGRDTHGSRCHRIPGSIGSSAIPSRVRKGTKLPGRAGGQRVTVKNLQVVDVRPELNVVMVKGAVPGASRGLVEITKA